MLRHFGLAVTSAVLISLLNALTLSPALCALLMRPERGLVAIMLGNSPGGIVARRLCCG